MKRIDIFYDAPNWCWYYQALDLCRFADTNRFDVRPRYCSEMSRASLAAVDATLHFSCMESTYLPDVTTVLAHHGPTFSRTDKSYLAQVATSEQRNLEHAKERLPQFRRILAVNRMLHGFAFQLNPNSLYMPPGVNREAFPYQKPHRRKKLNVGWCGQSDTHENTKGFHAVLKPLMKLANGRFNFMSNRRRPGDALTREEMRDWYAEIDVFLCTASTEGTPMPPLEAMACGRPVVSTPVGDLCEIIKPGENGLLSQGFRDMATGLKVARELYGLLRRMEDPRTRLRLGDAAHQTIADQRDWAQLTNAWLEAIQ